MTSVWCFDHIFSLECPFFTCLVPLETRLDDIKLFQLRQTLILHRLIPVFISLGLSETGGQRRKLHDTRLVFWAYLPTRTSYFDVLDIVGNRTQRPTTFPTTTSSDSTRVNTSFGFCVTVGSVGQILDF